ncbi:MAG: hypothetical protein M3352_10855 [Bacteroidota bacterium]|nr:hypothetical protein [Bacteroidota bacterium]
MSEQKFEKQVRQAMDELSLSPTAPLWDKIAAEIKRKKDRKRFVLWLLPLVLISSGIVWWTLSTNERSSNISQQTEPGNQEIKKEINNLNNIATPGKENTTVKAQSKKQEAGVKEENVTKSYKKDTHFSYTTAAKTKTKNIENKIASNAPDPIKKIKEEKLFSAETTVLTKEKLPEDQTKNKAAIIPNPLNQNKDLVIPQKTDTAQGEKQLGEKMVDTANASEQIDAQKPPNQKNKKLQFGATAQIGYSGITTGLFDGFGQKSLQDFASYSPIQNQAGGGINLPPSSIKRDISYSLGFNARKKLSSRSAISSGLQYQYYSTRVNVGTKADSTNNFSRAVSYYRNDNQSKDYTNQFYFITLPFSYDYQLFKKLPLHIGAGLQLSQLISSNALHYNSTANIYYKDNSLLNKTHVGLFIDLNYKLWRQKKFSLDLGPQFNYSLTPLQKNSGSKKQHLFSIGINTQVNF